MFIHTFYYTQSVHVCGNIKALVWPHQKMDWKQCFMMNKLVIVYPAGSSLVYKDQLFKNLKTSYWISAKLMLQCHTRNNNFIGYIVNLICTLCSLYLDAQVTAYHYYNGCQWNKDTSLISWHHAYITSTIVQINNPVMRYRYPPLVRTPMQAPNYMYIYKITVQNYLCNEDNLLILDTSSFKVSCLIP